MNRLIWNWYAFVYDAAVCNGLPYREALTDIVQIIKSNLKELKINSPRILDACCGTGNYIRELEHRIPESNLVGIDFSEAMLRRAKKKCPEVQFYQSTINEQLSILPAESLDVVLMINALYTLPQKRKALDAMRRVLRKGGVLIISDPKKGAKLSALLAEHFKKGNLVDRLKMPLFISAVIFSALLQYGAKEPFMETNALKALIIEAGFKIMATHSVYAGQNHLLMACREK